MHTLRHKLSRLTTIASFLLVLASLHWGRPLLIPLALAALLAFLLSPVVDSIHRRGLPRAPAVLLVVLLLFSIIGGVSWAIGVQLASLANELPGYKENIRKKIADFRSFRKETSVEKVHKTLREVAGEIRDEEQSRKRLSPRVPAPNDHLPENPIPVVIRSDSSLSAFLPSALSPLLMTLSAAALVAVLVFFLLLRLQDLRNRVIRLVGYHRLTTTTKAIDEAGARISRYLLMQSIINSTYGLAAALGLYCLGLPYATLWGFIAGVSRFIPYLGTWIGASLPVLLSLVVFAGWKMPLLVLAGFLVLELLANMLLEPLLYGQSAGVSEVALLIAVAFWTWIWGPIGLALATPLTVCLVVLSKYIPALEFLSLLMSDEVPLKTPLIFYQRLLAMDYDEARDILLESADEESPDAIFDRLFVPTLIQMKADEAAGHLTAEEQASLLYAVRDLLPTVPLQCPSPAPATGTFGHILACPAEDETDVIALHMLQRLLETRHCPLQILSAEMLSAEMIAQVEEINPAAICISSVPPAGLSSCRYLCKRLRSHFPDLKIIAARWGLQHHITENRELLLASGADYFATTLLETCNQVTQVLILAPPPFPGTFAEPLHHR